MRGIGWWEEGGGGGGGEVGGRREREVEDMFFCFKNEQLVHFEA